MGDQQQSDGGRKEGSQGIQAEVPPVPHCPRAGCQELDRTQPDRSVRPGVRPGGRLLLLAGQQRVWDHLERGHSVRVPREPQEIYQGHQDGVSWNQEGGGAQGPDSVPQDRVLSHWLRAVRDMSLRRTKLSGGRTESVPYGRPLRLGSWV